MSDPPDRSAVPRGARADADTAIGVALFVDAQTRAFGGSIAPPDYGLADLIATLPADAEALLGWIPNIAIDAVGFMFDPITSSFSVYATAGTAGSAKPSAQLLVADVPIGNSTAYVVGVTLSSSFDLSGTPLFGSLLQGISISNLSFTYASAPIPEGKVVLPPGAPTDDRAYPQGPVLSFTISDGTAKQDFSLSPSPGSSSSPSPGGSRDALALAGGQDPPIQWFSIQKTFGPLTLGRVGIVTGADEFGLALDAAVKTTALSVDLVGFTVAFSPKSDISLRGLKIWLDGLSVAFQSGALEIAGSLLRTVVDVGGQEITQYDGSVLIQAGPYGIAAVGSFAELDGSPSLFIFGLAEGQFGGPPAFFVTGIAAGFGFNRGLKLPGPDQVASFPFVLAAIQGPSYLPHPSPSNALAKLNQDGLVPPEIGSYWVAAGVRFTSFELVQAFALLTVQFGNELVIALLGAATVQLPQEGEAYARAEMTLDAVLNPREGTFQVTALLTPDSYVLYPDCRLTGGFAFYLWFGSNQHAGDFVVTLGGYHPSFNKPDWYPAIPRLGFDWNVSDEVHLQGGAYFALTPSCVMAGGELSLTFQSGELKAWFDASADFIMYWKPFFFDVYIGVSIGASYTLDLGFTHKTFSVELGADVELWGPPLKGKAHVEWWVISFTIPINGGGDPSSPGGVIDWPTFAATFLPSDQTTAEAIPAGVRRASGSSPPSNVCRPRAAAGLIKTFQDEGDTVWLVSADQFALATETVIPATNVIVAGPTAADTRTFTGPEIGVYPMGSLLVTTTHTIALYPWVDGQPSTTAIDLSHWDWTPVPGNAPQSLWGTQNSGQPDLDATVVPGILGTTATAPEPVLSGPPAMPLGVLRWTELKPPRNLPIPTTPAIDGSTPAPTQDPRAVIEATIAAPPVVAQRDAVVSVLNVAGVGTALVGGTMAVTSQSVFATFQAPPMLGPPGSTGPRASMAAPEPRPSRAHGTRRPRSPRPRHALAAMFHRSAQPVGSTRDRPGPPLPRWAVKATGLDGRAGRHDRAAAATAVAGGEGGRIEMTLPAGSTFLWELEPYALRAIESDAGLTLRITTFDHQYRVVDDVVLPAGDPTPYSLSARAEQVAITALTGVDEDSIAGWDGSSRLVQVGPQAVLGDRCVVRPQVPQRIRVGRGTRPAGLVTARDMYLSNHVMAGKHTRPGWIETTLPGSTATLTLTLRPDRPELLAARSLPDVATVSLDAGAHEEAARAVWGDAMVADDVLVLTADVRKLHGGDARVTARVQTEPGWIQESLVGYGPPSKRPGRRRTWPKERPRLPSSTTVWMS